MGRENCMPLSHVTLFAPTEGSPLPLTPRTKWLSVATVNQTQSALVQFYAKETALKAFSLVDNMFFAVLQTGLAESSVKTPQHTVTYDGHDVQLKVPLAPTGSVCPQLSGSLAVKKSDSLLWMRLTEGLSEQHWPTFLYVYLFWHWSQNKSNEWNQTKQKPMLYHGPQGKWMQPPNLKVPPQLRRSKSCLPNAVLLWKRSTMNVAHLLCNMI